MICAIKTAFYYINPEACSGISSFQGHVTFLRHAGATSPCPLTDITGGFNKFLAVAYGLSPTATAVQEKFGSAFGTPAGFFLFPLSAHNACPEKPKNTPWAIVNATLVTAISQQLGDMLRCAAREWISHQMLLHAELRRAA